MIRTVTETGSTNADMAALAQAGASEGDWLRAETQTAGRGRQGRAWISPVGNVSASTLVRLRPTDPMAATLAMVAAVAVQEAVGVFTGPAAGLPSQDRASTGPMLKWPNDLLLDGGKLAGILLDRVEDAVVVGIGINVAHHPDLPDRRTTSLAAYGIDVPAATVFDTLVEAFTRWLTRWRGEGFAPVRVRWLAVAHAPGTPLTARLPDGGTIDGLFDGMATDGALLLRLASGERRVIHAGDVFLL